MPSQLRLIKSDEPRAQFRADARLRLWGAVFCGLLAIALTAIGYDGSLPPVLAGPLAAAFLLWACYLALTFVGRRSERYTLTAARVEIERGILGKRYENVELWRIREVVLEQTLVERVRGVGRITLASSDAAQPSIVLGPVAQARRFYDQLVAATPKSAAQARALDSR
jgi:uncharacterized membrane protein YdbT with pleckstrin-like domain